MYDYVIVTHIPAFYKVNLYNELAKKLNIFVIFIASNTVEKRADDFVDLYNVNFEYKLINENSFQKRNKLKSIIKLNKLLKTLDYKKILVSGWDLVEFWFIILTVSKSKNCLALESTVLESNTSGLKGLIKKTFLSRITKVFASGNLHVNLLKKLNYKATIKITKGVGIINKPDIIKEDKVYKKRFLFIGRLSKVKNLERLIKVFNDLEEYTLTIVGDGEDNNYFQSIANTNIIFQESIENKKLKEKFRENDILILSSISEAWGLVVEEALYFGLPVIISKNCGSVELIEDSVNGYIINPYSLEDIKNTILKINNSKYKILLDGVNKFFINEKDSRQIKAYL